jgi:hypothetical protein
MARDNDWHNCLDSEWQSVRAETVALLARWDCQTLPSRSCGDQTLEDSQMCAAQLGGRVAAALCRLFVYLKNKYVFAQ